MIVRLTLLALSLVSLSGAGLAHTDVIGERKPIMRGNSAAAGTGTQLIRGEVPFDMARAREVFSGIQNGMTRFPALFPETSRTGRDTKAAPRIWEDMAVFRAA